MLKYIANVTAAETSGVRRKLRHTKMMADRLPDSMTCNSTGHQLMGHPKLRG